MELSTTTTKLSGALIARELETSKVGEFAKFKTGPVEAALLGLLASHRCVTWASERLDAAPVEL